MKIGLVSLSKAEKKIRQQLKSDFRFYAEKCLRIRAKDGRIVPLTLNTAQKYIYSEFLDQKKRTGRIRKVLLKGRQQGASTLLEGLAYHYTTHRPGSTAFVLAHEEASSQALFDMTKRYHEHCNPLVKPETSHSNAKELRFSRLDSVFKLGTAGNKQIGRGNTIQFLHASEVAFWPQGGYDLLAGVLQAIPSTNDTWVVLESTANGVGGSFYDSWQAASLGEGDYEPIFVPWFWQDEYRIDAPDFTATPEEREIATRFKLSDEQLAWRRSKIFELKSEELFRQEYPLFAEEAFIYSGRPVFMPAVVEALETQIAKPTRYRIDASGDFIADEYGELYVWDAPKSDRRYVVGGDVAEGLSHGDFSCLQVLDERGKLVASWHGHCAPDALGSIAGHLGKRYRQALVCIERNNHGLTTLTCLRDNGYQPLFVEEIIDRTSEGRQSQRLGWLTTSKSKPLIIDRLNAAIRDQDLMIKDEKTISELRTYVVADNGSTNALPGRFDDRVMALAIANEMIRHLPRRHLVESKKFKSMTRAGY